MAEIQNEVQSCLSCGRPLCETGCPVGNHIRDFIKDLKDENIEQAGIVLRSVNPFPELTTNLCDCESQCQGHCVRGIKGNSVEIQDIERYILANTQRKLKVGAPVNKKVALIGAGPACLSACVFFRENGWDVDVFEKEDSIGGAIYTGIPSYRFDKTILDTIYKELQEIDIKFHFHTKIGKDITLDTLRKSYDGVLIGIGAEVERLYGLEGKGCMGGLSLLYDLNIQKQHHDYQNKYTKALVWGGGNVAMDCARSLRRVLDDVTVVYRRSENEMPAARHEILEAKQEGIHFLFLENITSLNLDEDGNVISANVIRMELGEKDESGRARPVVIEGSEYVLDCDLVVAAIGESVDLSVLGDVQMKEGFHTNYDNVYIAGDAKRGADTVAAAIKEGREAALEMINRL